MLNKIFLKGRVLHFPKIWQILKKRNFLVSSTIFNDLTHKKCFNSFHNYKISVFIIGKYNPLHNMARRVYSVY